VEKDHIVSGATIREGDEILGLASSGAHSNGYSLIRKIIERNNIDLSADFNEETLIDVIMAPTRIYVKPLLELMNHLPVKGMAHITGGGLVENIPRVLPDSVCAVLRKETWNVPALFRWLQQQGNVPDDEMHRVFNCGVGMVVIVAPEFIDAALKFLRSAGETAWHIGTIHSRHAHSAQTVIE